MPWRGEFPTGGFLLGTLSMTAMALVQRPTDGLRGLATLLGAWLLWWLRRAAKQ